jgi:hypothetical protein
MFKRCSPGVQTVFNVLYLYRCSGVRPWAGDREVLKRCSTFGNLGKCLLTFCHSSASPTQLWDGCCCCCCLGAPQVCGTILSPGGWVPNEHSMLHVAPLTWPSKKLMPSAAGQGESLRQVIEASRF